MHVAEKSRCGISRGTNCMQHARMETWQTLAVVLAIYASVFVNQRFARA
jgi:hypothetical protein